MTVDAFRVHVVFDAAFDAGDRLFQMLVEAFDCVGMQREGLRFSVPVHRRSAAWGAAQGELSVACPRRIDLDLAGRNLVLILQDAVMVDRSQVWAPYVADIREQSVVRGAVRAEGQTEPDLLVPVLIDGADPLFERLTQSIRLSWADVLGDERQRTRFLIQLLNAVLVHRDPRAQRDASGAGHPIFVSHAKSDGVDIARQIVELIGKVNQKLGPRCFFDADSLLPGDNYQQRFDESIGSGSLLAVVTSAYHSRPWCRWEILRAKAFGRPVVAADLTDGRIERTFPYLGNVPSIRIDAKPDDTVLPDEAVERLTFALLSEALRVELWRDRAASHASPGDHLCIRPPEVSEVALLATAAHGQPTRVLYPDPPLGTEELDLLRTAFPHVEVRTLSQVTV